MHIFAILFVLFTALSIIGILADLIAPHHPKLEEIIYDLLDAIM